MVGLLCSVKSSFNRFALSKMSVENSLLTVRDGIKGIIELLTNVFKIDQKVFGAVLGILSLTENLHDFFLQKSVLYLII